MCQAPGTDDGDVDVVWCVPSGKMIYSGGRKISTTRRGDDDTLPFAVAPWILQGFVTEWEKESDILRVTLKGKKICWCSFSAFAALELGLSPRIIFKEDGTMTLFTEMLQLAWSTSAWQVKDCKKLSCILNAIFHSFLIHWTWFHVKHWRRIFSECNLKTRVKQNKTIYS